MELFHLEKQIMTTLTVLIADDDDAQRGMQKLVLQEVSKKINADIHIEETSDSIQTLKMLEAVKFDLVILDNEFKDGDKKGHLPGIAVLQLMRKGGPNMTTSTVFCSGDPYDTLKSMAEKYGAVYYPKATADADVMAALYAQLLRK